MSIEAPIRILQVSTRDHGGGAERVAYDLFERYRALGHRSRLAVGYRRGDDPDVRAIAHHESRRGWRRFWWRAHARWQSIYGRFPGSRALCRLAHALAEPGSVVDRLRGIEDFRYPGTRSLIGPVDGFDRNATPLPHGRGSDPGGMTAPPHRGPRSDPIETGLPSRCPDILHLHNLHGGYFDLRELPALSHAVFTIITLHDAWLLSGHCAHSFDCDRWQSGCGTCPDLTIYPAIRRDATAYNWKRKRDLLSRCRLHVATPCDWLMRKVERSILAPAIAESRVIPYGVDRTIFRPGDRSAARDGLGLPGDQHVVLFAANGLRRNVFKDYALIRSVATELGNSATSRAESRTKVRPTRPRPVLILGLGDSAPTERFEDVTLRFVPPVRDRRTVARCFQAADVYFHAARADTFPNAVLEALACATPVVATAVGGIPEQVRGLQPESGEGVRRSETFDRRRATGVLTEPGSTASAVAAITRLLGDDALRRDLGENAARDAALRFDLSRHADDYLAWYEHLLRPHRASPRDESRPLRAEAITA